MNERMASSHDKVNTHTRPTHAMEGWQSKSRGTTCLAPAPIVTQYETQRTLRVHRNGGEGQKSDNGADVDDGSHRARARARVGLLMLLPTHSDGGGGGTAFTQTIAAR